jgi:hypothetical protein
MSAEELRKNGNALYVEGRVEEGQHRHFTHNYQEDI